MIYSLTNSKRTDKVISTLDGSIFERVGSYTFLGLWLHEKLAFNLHIDNLLKKLKVLLFKTAFRLRLGGN